MISADKLRELKYRDFTEEELNDLLNSIEKIVVREYSCAQTYCYVYQDQLGRLYSRSAKQAAIRELTSLGYKVCDPNDEPEAILFISW